MKLQKRWYWVGMLAVVFALATAATLVKGDSSGGLIKFQAEGTAVISSSGGGYTGMINGNEIGSAKITDNSYALSSLGVTGNGPDDCFLGGGIITIATGSGSLNLVRSGIVCTISGTGITNGATSNTVYMITGGTGHFAGASGGGNFTVTINNGVGLIHIDGNIQIVGGQGEN
jgi:hypothetical protein